MHPLVRPQPSSARVNTGLVGVVAPAYATPAVPATSPPQAGTPTYLQQAYDLEYLSQTGGGGETIAIVDAYDDPTAEADLAVYRTQFGLPACTTANGCFRKVGQTGAASYPAQDSSWALEISLDLDAVSALAPNAHILLVEAADNSPTSMLAAQQEAALLGATQISDSWVSTSPMAGTFTFPGIATVAASGDDGYAAGTVAYPAALAGVTAVGGTSLTASSDSSNARGFSESAWSGSGSGCDTSVATPAWQTVSTGCPGRAYNDISADADPATGLDVYDSGYGGWLLVGGTSLATPLTAAYYAITAAAMTSPSWAYAHSAFLNDVTTGVNGTCTVTITCNAGVGYDGPTGVGSISGAAVTGAPGIGGTYTLAVDGDSAQLTGGVYPNHLDTSYWWEYGPTPAYGQQTTATDIGAGTTAVLAPATLAGLAPATSYHYRLVAHNSLGTSYGNDYTLSTTAAPAAPTVSSASASATGATTAMLSATVNARGAEATYRFAFGTTTALGMTTTPATVTGTTDTPVSVDLTGLAPATTYDYQLTATNSVGVTASAVQTFTTPASPGLTAAQLTTPLAITPPPLAPPPDVTPPAPAPPVAAAPQASLLGASLRRKTLTVTLRCVGVGTCAVRVVLRRVGAHPTALASRAIGVTGGRQVTVTVELKPTAAAASRGAARKRTTLTVSQAVGSTYSVAATRTLALSAHH